MVGCNGYRGACIIVLSGLLLQSIAVLSALQINTGAAIMEVRPCAPEIGS